MNLDNLDEDPRCDFCERRFIQIKNGVAVCAEHLQNVRDDRGREASDGTATR